MKEKKMAWIFAEAALALLLLIGLMVWTLRDAFKNDLSELHEESTVQNEESPHQMPHPPR
jgi:hypothetical protein